MNDQLITYLVIPMLIFLSRVADVSLGTVRIIMISKGYRLIAPMIGFIEILIWIMAISHLMDDMDNWVNYLAYAAGFSAGSYIGIRIEEKLALGYCMVRVITSKEADTLFEVMLSKNFHITLVDAKSNSGDVGLLYIVSKRQHVPEIVKNIKQHNPNAYYLIEDIRSINREVYFPHMMRTKKRRKIISLRKAK